MNSELLQKAGEARTPEELQALAKENGMDITPEQAREYFDRLHQTGELDDDELENVSGGCGGGGGPSVPKGYVEILKPYYYGCKYYMCKDCCWKLSKLTNRYPELIHINEMHSCYQRINKGYATNCHNCYSFTKLNGKYYCILDTTFGRK